MTAPETRLWTALRKLGLHLRRQAPIGRYVADFAIHEACLVIEVDSGWHDFPEAQLHDVIRDEWLRSQGYRVLRFRDQQVFDDLETVVRAVLNTLPPRWGKGRDGGARAGLAEGVAGGGPPPLFFRDRPALTPTQPSPIEGEGDLYSEAFPPTFDRQGVQAQGEG